MENYHELIPALDLPDPDDRHVVAAAIVANVDVIVTFNLRDFPRDKLKKYGIEAQHPDDFIGQLFDFGAVKGHISHCRRPRSIAESTEVSRGVHRHCRATAIAEYRCNAAEI